MEVFIPGHNTALLRMGKCASWVHNKWTDILVDSLKVSLSRDVLQPRWQEQLECCKSSSASVVDLSYVTSSYKL